MQLSPNFTLDQLTKSYTAVRLGIANNPTDAEIACLTETATHILEPIYKHFGPFIISSGYRSLELNKSVGGAATSQHLKGQAVDIEYPHITNFDLASWCKENVDFDQLILEFYTPGNLHSGWVHCSFNQVGHNRRSILTIGPKGTFSGLIK